MTVASPTVVTLETDSIWVLLIAASLVTLAATALLYRLMGRPGGRLSGLLLFLPLVVPPIAALVYEHAVLPEISVLRPVDTLFKSPRDLANLLFLSDGHQRIHMYAISGTAGRLVMIVGLGLSIVMVLRRLLGAWLVHQMIGRSVSVERGDPSSIKSIVEDLAAAMDLKRVPEVLLLPGDISGAFAVWGRRPRVLISKDLLFALDRDEARAVIAHELAHLEAHDVQLVFGAGMLRDLVAWNPLAHVALRSLVADRELEADRRAAEVTGEPLAVASGLIKVCEYAKNTALRRRSTALAFLRPRARVTHRVNRLLAMHDGVIVQPRPIVPYVLAAAMVVTLGVGAAARVAQENDGALAIVVGAPTSVQEQVWTPPAQLRTRWARHHDGHRVDNHHLRAFYRPTSSVAYREQDLPKWMNAVVRRIQRNGVSSDMIRQVREDWTAIPLVGFEQQDSWLGVYRVEHAAI